MKEHEKLERLPQCIAVYRSLIYDLVPELQSFEDAKIKAKSADTKQGNQSIKIYKKMIKFVTSHTLLVDLMNN